MFEIKADKIIKPNLLVHLLDKFFTLIIFPEALLLPNIAHKGPNGFCIFELFIQI